MSTAPSVCMAGTKGGGKSDDRQNALGILLTESNIVRIPGDVGNPATFPFAVRCKTVAGLTLQRLIRGRDRSLRGRILESARELVGEGIWALSTTCGFMILFQRDLADVLPVPVLTSSLLQLPFLLCSLGWRSKVGIITADAGSLGREHLKCAGVDGQRVVVAGLENMPHFRSAILENRVSTDYEAIKKEVLRCAQQLVVSHPQVGALLLECANLPPYAPVLQDRLGLPVYDFNTMILHARLAFTRVLHRSHYFAGF